MCIMNLPRLDWLGLVFTTVFVRGKWHLTLVIFYDIYLYFVIFYDLYLYFDYMHKR